MINPYPKILLINGEPFNNRSATGITISNLFKGWPIDRLAQIYTSAIIPDSTICDNNFKLCNKNLVLIGQAFRQHVESKDSNLIKNVSSNSGTSFARKHISPWIDIFPYRLSEDILQWISDYKPDLIYSLLGNIRLVNLVGRLSKFYRIPVVAHFMDDWLSTYSVHGKSYFTALQRMLINSMIKNLLHSRSPVGLTICDAMSKEYEERYGLRFESFMNPVTIRNKIFTQKATNGTLRLVYIGGAHLSRYENLKDIASVVDLLKLEGHDIEFNVYMPKKDIEQYSQIFDNFKGCFIRGTVDPDEVLDILQMNDVAVHVESFSSIHTQYTRLSLSTKIPQYMAAGLPILAYGPSYLASCDYIYKINAGPVVGSKNHSELFTVISSLSNDIEKRNLFSRNAYATAVTNHSDENVRNRFREILMSASNARVY